VALLVLGQALFADPAKIGPISLILWWQPITRRLPPGSSASTLQEPEVGTLRPEEAVPRPREEGV